MKMALSVHSTRSITLTRRCMKSCIYEGRVRHRRFTPRRHAFNYRLYMMYLDLDELPGLFDRFWLWSARHFNLAWFNRTDHMGEKSRPLKDVVGDTLFKHTGYRPEGPIRLLTHCRYFGFGFNPVSFYYCFDKTDTHIENIIAEVNNTPWGEQYCYVLNEADNVADSTSSTGHKQYKPIKDFHVSPFMPMNINYDWRFNQPGQRLTVHMQNFIDADKLFDATLDLEYRPINSMNMARVLAQYPVITLKVVVGIYYQALRLLLKRTPVYDHPVTSEKPASTR
ncbi:MAG: DUF1365 domain-containing protein [Gammaproteobacteria bacterium]